MRATMKVMTTLKVIMRMSMTWMSIWKSWIWKSNKWLQKWLP